MLDLIFKKMIRRGNLQIIDADGKLHDYGQAGSTPAATIRLTDKYAGLKLAIQPDLYFGEAYMDGRITVERGTIHDVIEIYALNRYSGDPIAAEKIIKFFNPSFAICAAI